MVIFHQGKTESIYHSKLDLNLESSRNTLTYITITVIIMKPEQFITAGLWWYAFHISPLPNLYIWGLRVGSKGQAVIIQQWIGPQSPIYSSGVVLRTVLSDNYGSRYNDSILLPGEACEHCRIKFFFLKALQYLFENDRHVYNVG